MTVVQNEATLSEKRRPGTGSSPKTAGSQNVNKVLQRWRQSVARNKYNFELGGGRCVNYF